VTEPDPESRTVLTDLGAIESWADVHGAIPVRSRASAGTPIGFDFAENPDDRISWDRFHTSFEQAKFALLVDGSKFAFVDRNRVTDTDTDE
jgi:hypothetical protein